jgi:hypothetical protein
LVCLGGKLTVPTRAPVCVSKTTALSLRSQTAKRVPFPAKLASQA